MVWSNWVTYTGVGMYGMKDEYYCPDEPMVFAYCVICTNWVSIVDIVIIIIFIIFRYSFLLRFWDMLAAGSVPWLTQPRRRSGWIPRNVEKQLEDPDKWNEEQRLKKAIF